MLGMELVKDRETKEPATDLTKELTKICFEKGLILLSCGNFGNGIRILMPFVITDEQLDRGLSILEDGWINGNDKITWQISGKYRKNRFKELT